MSLSLHTGTMVSLLLPSEAGTSTGHGVSTVATTGLSKHTVSVSHHGQCTNMHGQCISAAVLASLVLAPIVLVVLALLTSSAFRAF